MYTKSDSSMTPLTINTKTSSNGKGSVFSAAAFHYTEDPPRRGNTAQNFSQQQREPASASASRARTPSVGMSVQSPTSGPTLYVRALYDYDADDRTSLSFRQGDTIQVLTQLASGWWDGIINGVRGWFPSNYCQVIAGPEDLAGRDAHRSSSHGADVSEESGTDDDFASGRGRNGSRAGRGDGARRSVDSAENKEEEEAAFWIPQATPDGRLFYFNTLTGVSTMELPFETPTSANESGPRDRMNINMPDQTRPPPEMMARGLERDEDEYDTADSASEVEESSTLARPRRRRSYISDGVSPAVSTESFETSPFINARGFDNSLTSMNAVQPTVATGADSNTTYLTRNSTNQVSDTTIPRSFFDDGTTAPLTWNKLVDNIRRAIELYRQAISNDDRSEYVRKAEDVSDHLRMLLTAASGTTDNHSGNPSIISTNKALYPHYRDMMSRFSKLVLSSHIASTDFPAPDAYTKCLQEAEGVLHSMYSYVEVARSQRGEDLPRLVPGFVVGSATGGSWQSNGIGTKNPMLASPVMDREEYDMYGEPVVPLDSKLLERMDDLKRMVVNNIRRLEEHLTLREKLVSSVRHDQISSAVCESAGKVIEAFRPWMATAESVNLAPLASGSAFQNPQVNEFTEQKQKLYDLINQLVLACQMVAAPLGDEWADSRGDPLEERLNEVRTTARQLETCTSQLGFNLQLLSDMLPHDSSNKKPDIFQGLADDQKSRTHRTTDPGTPYDTYPGPPKITRPTLADMSFPNSYSEGVDPTPDHYRKPGNESKVKKFFGEVPREIADEPSYLKLDYEGELSYDFKVDPPLLRGGTLIALVEQLTRHDKLDSGFNNTFLLTYRSFTTATELFEMLVKRFSIQPPRGISSDDYKTWVEKKQKPIRFRIVNILKSWFDNNWMEDANETTNELLRRVYTFARDSIATSATPGSGALMASVERRMKGEDSNAKGLIPTQSTSIPPPIMPKNMKKLKFLDIDPTEFARQLTIIESRLYGKIKPKECLSKHWSKKVGPDEAPNVKAFILHSNQLTNWVAEMILNQSDVKKRVVVIKHFVTVADKCRAMNNFSTMVAITSALGVSPIARLARTWAQVNARTNSMLEQMNKLSGTDKNFSLYRETLHSANPPCIPFLGVYLTDLTFIEDGIPSVIKKTDLINFNKRAKAADVIRDIQQYQNVPYPLKSVGDLQDYILSNMQAAGDVHEAYDKSLQVEPREREDEKITRLVDLGLVEPNRR
ncbi:cell division cycle-related protein [Lecanora helva]